MRITIRHTTHFAFETDAVHSIQYLRLTPRNDPCQSVLGWTVSASGHLSAWTDGFDNQAHVTVQDEVHREAVIVVEGEVETVDTKGILPLDDGLPPLIFKRPSPYTELDEGLVELADGLRETFEADGRLAGLHALNDQVADQVQYMPGVTDVLDTAAHALEKGQGVCQDQAHVFIAGARALGIPARYVSGYLLAGIDNESHLASHAWAEALVDDLGWVSFDPANRQCATDAYVRLAVGMDYCTASPVRGVRQGGGVESMDVSVQVEQQ